jgi:hypothetical protein
MITLKILGNLKRPYEPGEVLHLKVVPVQVYGDLVVQDVTPLPGHEPPGYACWSCGIVMPAQEDGSLPEGWMVREYGDGVNYPKGSHFVCELLPCQEQRMCRLCGCTDEHACEPPCSWVELDRCSGCAG